MQPMYQLSLNAILSLCCFYATYKIIPRIRDMFIKSNLYGIDLCKADRTTKVAESQGVVAGCVYLMILFFFIPIHFAQINLTEMDEFFGNFTEYNSNLVENIHRSLSNYHLFVQFLAGLLSICCMLCLGFADDVLDLRWRVKLVLPMVASLPLLMVYALTYNNTTIIVPKPLRFLLGLSLDLGLLYYIFLSMLAVFCTNAINIVAGVNGIEVGQGLLISLSIIAYNIIEIVRLSDYWISHIFSLHMMLPFLATSLGLFYHNWYPASVFVGDTYCYFAGMTFAVVGILGHFSKTMLLFFIPQIFNFLYSCPQLFHLVDCPRHRLPKFDAKSGLLMPSTFIIDEDKIGTLGALSIKLFRLFRLVRYRQVSARTFECTNLTIINLVIVICGPIREDKLTIVLFVIQFLCTLLAFFIRYGVSQIFY